MTDARVEMIARTLVRDGYVATMVEAREAATRLIDAADALRVGVGTDVWSVADPEGAA